jgi:hypothetical protein
MQITTLILALLSANTLAAPLDATTTSFPSLDIDNSTSPLSNTTTTNPSSLEERRLVGGQLTSWRTPDCKAISSSQWNGKVTKITTGCVNFAPRDPYVSVNLNFGVLQVYQGPNCGGRLEGTLRTPKRGGNSICMSRGNKRWGSVKLFQTR